MQNVIVFAECRVLPGKRYPIRVTLTETNEGEPFVICDVCDNSDNRDDCIACWKHVREVLESGISVSSGMIIK